MTQILQYATRKVFCPAVALTLNESSCCFFEYYSSLFKYKDMWWELLTKTSVYASIDNNLFQEGLQ